MCCSGELPIYNPLTTIFILLDNQLTTDYNEPMENKKNVLSKEDILRIAGQQKILKTRDLVDQFGVSRQWINILIRSLIAGGKLIKIGSTAKAFYVLPSYVSSHPEILPTRFKKTLRNKRLEEHKILDQIEKQFLPIQNLSENVRSIFAYAFSEMLNNAIEHSRSRKINIEIEIKSGRLRFEIGDFGVGVFRNVMQTRHLKSELEAIQDLLKGKTTTMPKSHSGEGIFFTSKVADVFKLDSYGYKLIVDNQVDDIFVKKPRETKRGTRAIFILDAKSDKHLNHVFSKYTTVADHGAPGFNKTEIKIKLYTLGGVYVSRSQARRVLFGLEQFKTIIMDFDKVEMVGQAFADEIFRVFKNRYPDIHVEAVDMNDAVAFMVNRALAAHNE